MWITDPYESELFRYDVACHRFFNKLLERSAAKNSARVTRSNNFGRVQSALENRKGHRTVALVVSRLCIHDSVQGFALAAAGRSLCFLKNAMIGLPQREQNEYVAH
jgi:hypothetical protein